MSRRGAFIALEGVEGVGKSTVLRVMAQTLETWGVPYRLSREPGGTPVAEKIRKLLLEVHEEPLLPETEALLMFASRVQHLRQCITPTLNQGIWLLSDRYVDASFAYQGGGRSLGQARVQALEDWITDFQPPDCVLILDAPLSLALDRMRQRGALDRMEREDEAFFARVREVYLQRAQKHPERYRLIDATASEAEVAASVVAQLTVFRDRFEALGLEGRGDV